MSKCDSGSNRARELFPSNVARASWPSAAIRAMYPSNVVRNQYPSSVVRASWYQDDAERVARKRRALNRFLPKRRAIVPPKPEIPEVY